MSSHTIEDLTSCILDFQGNMVRVTYRKKTTLVEPDAEPGDSATLDYIWTNSKVREEPDSEGGMLMWRKLGFDSEDLHEEFREVGVLGLDCLVRRDASVDTNRALLMQPAPQKHFVAQDPDFFAKVAHRCIASCYIALMLPSSGNSRAAFPTSRAKMPHCESVERGGRSVV
jgi:engulfment and cell motility protein 1